VLSERQTPIAMPRWRSCTAALTFSDSPVSADCTVGLSQGTLRCVSPFTRPLHIVDLAKADAMGMSCRAVALLCVSGSLLSGCGGDSLGRHAISGNVTLDGAPVENGNIAFQPVDQGVTSSGTAFTGGKYALTDEQGLPAGKYLVTVSAPKPGTGGTVPEGAMPGDPVPPPQELIPPEWNVKSAQTIEVKESGPFEFNFEIVTKGK